MSLTTALRPHIASEAFLSGIPRKLTHPLSLPLLQARCSSVSLTCGTVCTSSACAIHGMRTDSTHRQVQYTKFQYDTWYGTYPITNHAMKKGHPGMTSQTRGPSSAFCSGVCTAHQQHTHREGEWRGGIKAVRGIWGIPGMMGSSGGVFIK